MSSGSGEGRGDGSPGGEPGRGEHGQGGGGGGIQASRAGLVRNHADGPEPTVDVTPFELLGGSEKVRAIVERFYDAMSEHEPALARLHPCDAQGRVTRVSRDRFGLFLIGWLGGPDDYLEQHGHPRLRRRHATVPVNDAMRDAWLRSMQRALDAESVTGPVRSFLDARLAEVADFLRNTD